MENKLSEMMQLTLGDIKSLVEVNNIVGEPIFTPDGMTFVPVSKLSFAFGGGGGEHPANGTDKFGGGSAAGVKIEPLGFLVIKESSVRMVNVQSPAQSSMDRVLELVPQVMDKVEHLINRANG